MNRRQTTLGLLALGVAPCIVRAQASRIARVVYLSSGSREGAEHLQEMLRERLRELGHVEGRNLVLDMHFANRDPARLSLLVGEIVAQRPDAVVAAATPEVLALQRAMSTVPIVAVAGDIAGMGLVKNLARPEGNITGMSTISIGIGTKLLELALAINPKNVAVLANPAGPLYASAVNELRASAAKSRVSALVVDAQTVAEIDAAFVRMAREHVKTLVVVADGLFFVRRKQIAEQAVRHRIGTVFSRREYVESGGLIGYGSDLADSYRLAANYVDRIVKGAKVADLPVQQPTKFELAVNLKTAKAIGITIPRDLLLRADVTIQ